VVSGSTANYTYDTAGNVTNDGVHGYTYDAENRLVSVDGGSATYAYDQSNQRYKKVTVGTTTHYIWQGSQVIAEHNGTTGASTADYVYSGSRMIAKAAGLTTQYFLSDRLSVRLVLNTSGSVLGRMAHAPFGEDFAQSGSQEKHHFTGYERDPESALDYAVNRTVAPGVARFQQADPYKASAYKIDPQSWNRYSYARNNPVTRVDALGLQDGPGWTNTFGWRNSVDVGASGNVGRGGGGGGDEMLETDPVVLDPGIGADLNPGTWHVDPKALGKCVEELYGVTLTSFTPSTMGQGGNFVGFGPDKGAGGNNATITITNDVGRYSRSRLRDLENAFRMRNGDPLLGPDDEILGITIEDSTHNAYTNYTASDLTDPGDILRTQVHELGHSLALVTRIENNAHGTGWEQGKKLVKCMDQNRGFLLY